MFNKQAVICCYYSSSSLTSLATNMLYKPITLVV